MEKNTPNDHLFPVADIKIETMPNEGYIMLCLDFLTSPLQSLENADAGRNYVLTQEQALYLSQTLQRALHALENAGSQPTPTGHQH